MMGRVCVLIMLFGCCFNTLVGHAHAHAQQAALVTVTKCIVDVHGVETERAKALLRTYAPQIQALELQITAVFLRMSQGYKDTQLYRCLVTKRKHLIAEIVRHEQFEFVDLQTVFYPQDKNIYTTINIIDHAHIERKRFLTKPVASGFFSSMISWYYRISHLFRLRHDVIQHMIRYQADVVHLWMTHQLDNEPNDCPVYHCIASFQHPRLQPYFPVFQQAVVRDKAQIIDTLRFDPNPERRAAAVLLMGHCSNPKDITTVLSGCVADPDPTVRNNALRVIASTLYHAHLSNLDSTPFIALLESPYVTDRNKALNILIVLSDNPLEKMKIIRLGGEQVVTLLGLIQPDNHDLAYSLLKKLSHQDFGEHDERRWLDWVKHVNAVTEKPTMA